MQIKYSKLLTYIYILIIIYNLHELRASYSKTAFSYYVINFYSNKLLTLFINPHQNYNLIRAPKVAEISH